MPKRPPPPPIHHPSKTDWPRPPAVPLSIIALGFGEIALAQEIADLCHRRNIPPKVAALACVMATATFSYQTTDPAGVSDATDALARVLGNLTAMLHIGHPKPPGTLAPEPPDPSAKPRRKAAP